MQTIKKISQKYNTTMQDLRNFKRDKRDRKQKDLQDDTNFLQVEKENFNAQIQNILEKTKMTKLKNIVKGKEYENKSLLIFSSIFSTLGILLDNNWIRCENGLHKNFKWLSFTTLLCLIVAHVFYKIMDKAYKHFFNVPFLLKKFDKDDKKEKIIDFISIGFVLGLIGFSMVTNTIAFKGLGANTTTSIFLGYGIDIINLICVWFKNKFTSLNGYNSNRPDNENLDKNNAENLDKNNAENLDKKLEKNTNLKNIQNCDNKGIDTNLGLNFFSKKIDEKLDENLDKKLDKNLEKNNDKKYGKAGRKMDKKTRERIIKEIEKLEKDKPVTRKNVNYKGDDKMLKRLCHELEKENKLVYSKKDKNNRVRFYRK